MVRIKRGSINNKKHKKIIKLNKSFQGSHSRLFRTANQQNKKSLVYSYIGRKLKKRTMKNIWIKRINENNFKYNLLKKSLKDKKIILNIKIVAKLIELDPKTIKNL